MSAYRSTGFLAFACIMVYTSVHIMSIEVDAMSSSSCMDLGFNEVLPCHHCKLLETFVSNEKTLVSECSSCCSEKAESDVQFTSAILEMCPHSIQYVIVMLVLMML